MQLRMNEGQGLVSAGSAELPDDCNVRSFEAVIGQETAVAILRDQVKSLRPSAGLILQGEGGAGKRTLARLFAMAMHCQIPAQHGSPCHECDACRSYEEKRSFDAIEIDAREHGSTKSTTYLANRVSRPPLLGRWRVVLITNAEACRPEAFDVLLKTLEEPSLRSIFILTTADLREVRLAAQSRCRILSVESVEPQQAREHLQRLCSARELSFEDDALELIVTISGGYIGRAVRTWWKVAQCGELSVTNTLSVMDLTWAGSALAFFEALLKYEVDAQPTEEALSRDAREAVRRMRVVMLVLQGRASQMPLQSIARVDPAFYAVTGAQIESVTAMLEERATARGATLKAFLAELAKFWIEAESYEPVSLGRELRAFRRLLNE